uniref:Splicing factor U2af large subunit A n=1 Tax=Noccaea caerulescens TaxID=107243 RepID=A0A1J3J8A8_NOCCA
MHARRLHVSRLPPTASVLSLASFFNGAMLAVGGTTGAVVSVCIDFIKKYALVEMRTAEEAKAAMHLDGLYFEGYPVVVRRPRDFNHYAA